MKFRLAVLFGILWAIFLLSIVSHTTASEDVAGWDKAKWGMSIEEIKSIYNVRTIRNPIVPPDIEMDYKIGRYNYIINFDFLEKQLYKISIRGGTLSDKLPTTTVDQFRDMEKVLIDKYGKAKEQTQSGETTLKWEFPSTIIIMEGTPGKPIRIWYKWKLWGKQKKW